MNVDPAARPVPGPPPGTPTLAQPRPDGPEARLAAAMAGLAGLDERPTGDHVAVFEQVHLALTDALSAIDGV